MSIAIFVRLLQPIPLCDVESSSSLALQQLLNLDTRPTINARFDLSSQAGDPSEVQLSRSSKRVLCSLSGHDEEVAIVPLIIPVQIPANDSSCAFTDQCEVSIYWEYKRSPLCYALNAGVAVGIARNQCSEIEDNSGFFTMVNDQTPEEFTRILRLSESQSDIERAAAELYAKMPKSNQLIERLGGAVHL